MPTLELKATLTGFPGPQGECADNAGHIWVANTKGDLQSSQMIELSRTGSIINTINVTLGFPVSCAVNPINGALAVTDIYSYGGVPGQVLVYATPSSQPTVLTNPSQYYYYFAGYDSAGNLRVDGLTYGSSFILSACGASSCSTVPLTGGEIYFPGAVMWDNVAKTWVVFDQYCGDTFGTCSYAVSDSGVLGTPTTYLGSNGANLCDMVQAAIAANGRKYVVGGNFLGICETGTEGNFNRWAYPAAGAPTNATHFSRTAPVGSAISTK